MRLSGRPISLRMGTNSNIDPITKLICELCNRSSYTVDRLVYTAEFDRLHAEFQERLGQRTSKHDLWRAMANARKAGRLVRKAR